MIDFLIRIDFEKVKPLEVYLFSVDTSKKNTNEVAQAVNCEKWYNESELDFGGLIYKGE